MTRLYSILVACLLLVGCSKELESPDLIYGQWRLHSRTEDLVPDLMVGNRTLEFSRDGMFRYDRGIGGDCVNRFSLDDNLLRLRGICGIGGRWRIRTLSQQELVMVGMDGGERVRLVFRR